MSILSVYCHSVQADSQPIMSSGLVLGRRPLGAVLHSSNELGELLQWLCHDDSTINIVLELLLLLLLSSTVKLPLTEHVLDDDFILLAKHSECVPARLTGRYWMGLDPAAAGELVEVIARLHSVVHRVQNGARRRHARLRCTQTCHTCLWRHHMRHTVVQNSSANYTEFTDRHIYAALGTVVARAPGVKVGRNAPLYSCRAVF